MSFLETLKKKNTIITVSSLVSLIPLYYSAKKIHNIRVVLQEQEHQQILNNIRENNRLRNNQFIQPRSPSITETNTTYVSQLIKSRGSYDFSLSASPTSERVITLIDFEEYIPQMQNKYYN